MRPLYIAALNGRHKCLPLLIDAGALVNDRNVKVGGGKRGAGGFYFFLTSYVLLYNKFYKG